MSAGFMVIESLSPIASRASSSLIFPRSSLLHAGVRSTAWNVSLERVARVLVLQWKMTSLRSSISVLTGHAERLGASWLSSTKDMVWRYGDACGTYLPCSGCLLLLCWGATEWGFYKSYCRTVGCGGCRYGILRRVCIVLYCLVL